MTPRPATIARRAASAMPSVHSGNPPHSSKKINHSPPGVRNIEHHIIEIRFKTDFEGKQKLAAQRLDSWQPHAYTNIY